MDDGCSIYIGRHVLKHAVGIQYVVSLRGKRRCGLLTLVDFFTIFFADVELLVQPRVSTFRTNRKGGLVTRR